MSMSVYFFISPHLDDVVLSCGGYICHLAATGKHVVIATVVTADAPADMPLSRGMHWRHMIWHLKNSPFASRRQEDATAASILGVQYIHLGMLDAMYRCNTDGRPLYQKDLARVPVHSDDWNNYEPVLRGKLQQVVDAWNGVKLHIFCPLAIGEHVDHIIVRSAIERVCDPRTLIYYEDYPYVTRSDAIWPEFCTSGEKWRPKTYKLEPKELEARIAAVACYVSQIPILFPSTLQRWQNRIMFHFPIIGPYLNLSTDLNTSRQRIALSLRSHIASVGGERFWFQGVDHCLARADQGDKKLY